MLIPYVRRNLFETLPPIVRYKVGGVPAISIVGAICTISFAYLSYLYYVMLCCMANLFCNVLVKFGEAAVEAEQGAIRELAWKKSHATQHYVAPQITTAGIYGTALMVGAFVLGIAIYLGSRAYWRSKGIAVDLAFKELPPD